MKDSFIPLFTSKNAWFRFMLKLTPGLTFQVFVRWQVSWTKKKKARVGTSPLSDVTITFILFYFFQLHAVSVM